MNEDFSQDRLEGLWRLRNGFVFMHDVDYSLEAALAMAEAERRAGVRSTYYFRTVAEEYTRDEAWRAAEAVHGMGHLAGVHVDLGLPRSADPTPQLVARKCLEQLELPDRLVGRRVSLHAPPHACRYMDVPRFLNAVSPRWQGRYCADSRGVFRREPERMAAEHGSVLLNLHPEWWFLPEDEARALRAREAMKP